MAFSAPKGDIRAENGFTAPTKDQLDSTRQSTTAGDPVGTNAPTLGDFVSTSANVLGSAVAGAPLELANQVGQFGNLVGIDNQLPERVQQSKDILINAGLSPAGLNAGAAGIQGAEIAAAGAGVFAGAGLVADTVLPLAKLSKFGLDGGLVKKIAGLPVRFLSNVLKDSTVQVGQQVAGQAKAFGAASATASGIEDDNARLAAELLGSMSILGLANGSRAIMMSGIAGKRELGSVLESQPTPFVKPDLLDGEIPTLASVTQNPTVKATEKLVRGRNSETDILFRNIDDENAAIAKEYATSIAGKPVIDKTELAGIQERQLLSVEAQTDAAIEHNALLQQTQNPLEAGQATEVLLGKTLDSAMSTSSALYDEIGNSVVKATDMLPAISKALNIADLKISAGSVYPKIKTLLDGMRATIKNKPSEVAIDARLKLTQELKAARKTNDFVKANEIKKSLSKIKGGVSDKTPVGMLSITQIQGSRSLLLQGIREANAAGQSDLARRYSEVMDAVESSLTKAEQAGNIDVAKLREANANYRQLKNTFGLGEIAKTLQVNKAGGAQFSVETLGNRFIKTNGQNAEETAKQVVASVRRYAEKSGVSFEDLQNQMRQQFAAMIAVKSMSAVGGRLKSGAVKNFIANHKDALRAYGIEKDFNNLVTSAKTADSEILKLGQEKTKILNLSFVAKLLKTDDPLGLVKSSIKNNSLPEMLAQVGEGKNKDELRGFIILATVGDLNNAFAGNGLKEALTNSQIRDALGLKRMKSLQRLSDAVDRNFNVSSNATPIQEAKRRLPEAANRKIERFGRRFFSQIRSAQNKVSLTAFESVLNNASQTSHEVLVNALMDGKGADMLVKFSHDNPDTFRLMLKQALASTAVSNQINTQENNNVIIQR